MNAFNTNETVYKTPMKHSTLTSDRHPCLSILLGHHCNIWFISHPVTYWLIQPCFVAPSSPAKSWQAEAGQGMSELGQLLVGYWSSQEHNSTHQTERKLVSLAVNCWLQNNGHVFRYLQLVKKNKCNLSLLSNIFL